jgi:outer membrane protein assembly factor BamB
MRAVFLLLAILSTAGLADSPARAASPPSPLGQVQVRGGLAVWVAGDEAAGPWASALARLHDEQGMLVLGLHPDPDVVGNARNELAGAGKTGPVVVDVHGDRTSLPLIDHAVNLLVISGEQAFAEQEIRRVLATRGEALVAADGGYRRLPGPALEGTDEWTHYLHDASNNAVAHDDRVGPPRHLQWQAGPRWSRHHDHMSSVSAVVTSGGRVFTILDEGSYLSPQLPADWKLVARDALNGALLWQRPIARWQTHLWPLKSGPADLPRRLVASGETVYATLGIDAAVSVLDAETGETIRELAETSGAEEILHVGDAVIVLVNRTPVDYQADAAVDPEQSKSRDSRTTYSPAMGRIWSGIRSPRWSHGDRVVMAFDAADGRPLWKTPSKVIPLTLAADAERVYYHDGTRIVALGLMDGRQRWATEPVPVWEGLEGQGLQSWFAPTLVACQGTVLFAGGEKTHMSYMGWGSADIGQDTMTAFSSESGKRLWTAPSPYSGYNSPEDLFVAQGKVWTGNTAKGDAGGRYLAYDLKTGNLVNEFPPTVDAHWFHHRCHRAKATDNYILCSRTGIELVDLVSGEWTINHWVRGACLYGIMPANGLIYSPPHPCACYPEAKLNGFTALAPARQVGETPGARRMPRLQKGAAYGTLLAKHDDRSSGRSETAASDAWPTYRSDPARSGAASGEVPEALSEQWALELGGVLTQPIVAEGRLFVADREAHKVHAVDIASGQRLWTHVAGGRVDSPPTFYRGRLLFGEASGYVTCLRASDGALDWRFQAAPADRRLVSYDQVESVWPVHGSVLAADGVATVVAGRSMFLDGGLRFVRLDAVTGEVLGETGIDDRIAEEQGDLQDHIKGLNMPVALTDILSSDGERLYMRSQVMDLAGNRLALGPAGSGFPHLFAPYGFTDDSWFHRTYWIYGDGFQGGVGGYGNGKKMPAGRILVNNDSAVFGYGRKQEFFRWTSVLDYQLFAADKAGLAYRWTRDVPIHVRAMALAGDRLVIAGPPDLLDELAAFEAFEETSTQEQLLRQDAAFAGKSSGLGCAKTTRSG